MDIRLKQIAIRNFKVHKSFVFTPDCRDASVFGDNKLGKTTIYDAFCWLLFNKDGRGKTDFTMKPTGSVRPEVEVEAILAVDGRDWTFKKILTENWVTKRQSGSETFSGHTIRYFINDLEVPLGDYKARLDSFMPEDTFKRLTSANYILTLKRPDLRRLLVDMAGDVDTDMIVRGDSDLTELVAFMQSKDYSIDDMLKLAKQNLSLYNAENESISVRIDESGRNKPKEPEGGWTKVEQGIEVARRELEKIDLKLASMNMAKTEARKTAGEIETIEIEIRAMRTSMLETANEDKAKAKRNLEAIKDHAMLTHQKAKAIIWQQDLATASLTSLETQVKTMQTNYAKLRVAKKEIADAVFVPIEQGAASCDKCGQTLPETAIDEMNRMQQDAWAAHRELSLDDMDRRLADMADQGQTLATQLKSSKENFEAQKKELESLQYELTIADSAILDAQRVFDETVPATEVDLSADPAYQAKLERIETLKKQLATPNDSLDDILAYKKRVEVAATSFRTILQGKEEIRKAELRVAELTDQGKKIAGQVAYEKKRQSLCELFIRRKAELLSEKINGMFTDVTFRLFDTQINGAIADDCTPLIKVESGGFVELGLDASNSEQINAGLDIVSALQKYEGITVPVWIDNCEAVTKPKAMNCQVIKLVVSEADQTLRVVVKEPAEPENRSSEAPTMDGLEQIDFSDFIKGVDEYGLG